MKNLKAYFLLFLVTVFSLAISCKSTPKAPDQDTLNSLNAATARVESARAQAVEVEAQDYFPDEWKQAESDYQAGKAADKATAVGANEAIERYTLAADVYEEIAEKSAPLYAKDLEEAKADLEKVMARAGKSRQDASDTQSSGYFPGEWDAAEVQYQNGENSDKETLRGIRAAIASYTAAADTYDDIAEKSRPLLAADKDSLQAAIARAQQSRKEAQDLLAPTYFPDEWTEAEAGLQAGIDADKNTPDEMKAAAVLYVAAADVYDDLAERSRPLFANDTTRKDLEAAIARAESSRQKAMEANGQGYLANDWRSAESALQSAKNAGTATPEEMLAATALYVTAANAYDDIARRSAQMLAKEREDAMKALQAAITRAQQSRTQATNARGQTLFPNEWRNAETRNQTATNAKRETVAEIKAAVPLYNAAADAYDDVTRRSAERTAQEARDNAGRARQAALDAKANVAVEAEYNRAETVYQQATRDFGARNYPNATNGFNQSTTQFTAAATAAGTKRNQAETAVARAKERAAQSVALATSVGEALEEENNE